MTRMGKLTLPDLTIVQLQFNLVPVVNRKKCMFKYNVNLEATMALLVAMMDFYQYTQGSSPRFAQLLLSLHDLAMYHQRYH
jgi:hypothetical protein